MLIVFLYFRIWEVIMDQVVIVGRITTRPNFVRVNERKCYLNFFMRFGGNSKKHVYIQVALTDNLARKMNKKLKEGYVVEVTRPCRNVWQDKNGRHHDCMKIFADKITRYEQTLPPGFDMPGWK